MVKANHQDSPENYAQPTDIARCLIENGCLTNSSSSSMDPAAAGHCRNISSSASSLASSTTSTNPVTEWGFASTLTSSSLSSSGHTSVTSDCGDRLRWNKHDLIQANLTSIPNSVHTSSSEDYDDEERIKLLCGDDPDEDWVDVDTSRIGGGSADDKRYSKKVPPVHPRRRRIFPKLSKIVQRVRKKFNWQLLFLLTVILIICLSMSHLDDYQHNSVGIVGWDLNTTRDTAVYTVPDQYTATLEPRVIDRQKRYLLLVIVCSAVENFDTRQAIRQTWANGSEFNYENYFHRMHSHATHESYAAANSQVVRRVNRQLFGGGGDDDDDEDEFDTTLNSIESDKEYLIQRLHFQVLFLVGKTLSNATQQLLVEESGAFGDLIQENFVDTYNNLTLKSLMLLKWINNFNKDTDRVKYVMKCDDDTFLNLPNLMHVLLGGTVPIYKDTFHLYDEETIRRRSWADSSSSLVGFLFRHAKPIRDITSKWYAPKYMYRKKVYPNYLSGTGYVIEATRTAKELYRVAFRTPIFHLEDVYVTGLCASRSWRTKPQHSPLFSFLRYAKKECALRGMITQHPLTASDIRRAYERLTNGSNHCEQPSIDSVRAMMNIKSSAHVLGQSPGCWWMIFSALFLLF